MALACEPLTQDLSGAIAVVSRGECTFSTKVRHAEDAGAVAVVVVNGVAVIPAGSTVLGHVTQAERAGRVKGHG